MEAPSCVDTCAIGNCEGFTENGQDSEGYNLCRKPSRASCLAAEKYFCKSRKMCVNRCQDECRAEPVSDDETSSCVETSQPSGGGNTGGVIKVTNQLVLMMGQAIVTKIITRTFQHLILVLNLLHARNVYLQLNVNGPMDFFLTSSGCKALEDGESHQLDCSSSATGVDMSDRQQQFYVFLFVLFIIFCVCYFRCKRTGPIVANGKSRGKKVILHHYQEGIETNSLINNDGEMDDDDDLEAGWGEWDDDDDEDNNKNSNNRSIQLTVVESKRKNRQKVLN